MFVVPAIIDVEASGFGPDSYPIEIGVVGKDGFRFCSLIQPADHWSHWDDSAESVHHITRKTLNTFGRDLVDVAKALNKHFANQTLFTDGWVVDKPWVTRLFHTANVPMQFSISALEMTLREEQMAIWHQTKDEVIESLNLERHRASNDAVIIQETYRRTLMQLATTANAS